MIASTRFRHRLFTVLLAAAVVTAVVWLWVCWCLFPVSPWNDVRLAPSFALARGLPVYPAENTGAASTWIYGPLPVLLWWPATWVATAAHAVLTAGAINLLVSVAAIGMVCAAWPEPAGLPLSQGDRVLAATLAIALWPRATFQFLQADNVAEALGLISLLVMMLVRSRRGRWSAAVLAVGGLACKQTSLGVPVAEIIWLGFTVSWREAGRHTGRCLISGLLFAGLMVAGFGWPGLRLNMLSVPGHLPWVPQPGKRLLEHLPELCVQLIAPLVLIVCCRRTWLTRTSVVLLPALAWAFSVPPGLAALFKIGGNLNSLQGFGYWLPSALLWGLATARARPRTNALVAAATITGMAICAVRIWHIPSVSFRPLVEHYRQADVLARSFSGEIWFPWNPLVTIYSEKRFYHAEDGLYMRFLAGHPLTMEHARQYLPANLCVLALPRGGTDWGIALSLAPANARVDDFGLWTLHSWPPLPGASPAPRS
jgi:hypothetical protein